MKQIRLCWRPDVRHPQDIVIFDGTWREATDDVVRDVQLLLAIGLDVHGPGSHWIEKREVEVP